MIHEVRVLAPSGKVKQIISGEKLSHSHWEKFESRGNPFMLNKTERNSAWKMERPDMEVASFPVKAGAYQINLETML